MREIEGAANRLLGLRHSNELLGSGCQYLWKEISVGNPSDYVDGYGMGERVLSNTAAEKEARSKYSKTAKGKASAAARHKKYEQSKKGKAALKRYRQSEKGKAVIKRYQQSPKGIAARKRSKSKEKARRAAK